jgi:hypothetical protein
MKISRLNLIAFVFALSLLPATYRPVSAQAIPNPVLSITSTESFEQNGKRYVKYHFAVSNRAAFPAEMFAAAPDLPPCGQNTRASRTWADLYDHRGKRLNGFCALSKPAELGDVWFVLEEGVIPPSWVYLELTDRKTNTKYKSNEAETSQ